MTSRTPPQPASNTSFSDSPADSSDHGQGPRAALLGRFRAKAGRLRTLLLIIGVLAVVALIVFGVIALQPGPNSGGEHDLLGNAVALEPDAVLPPETLAEMDAVADTDQRFQVPSVGLDVPLGALNMAGGSVTPPGFTSAYLIRNLGVSPDNAADGTVFVVMHSLRGGGVGPGNYLIDPEAKSSKLTPGTRIEVAGLGYTVIGDSVIAKPALEHDAEVWGDVPRRLVIITCLQRPSGAPSVDNVIITAELDT